MAKSFLREKTEPAIFGIWPVGYSGPRSPRDTEEDSISKTI